MCQPPLVWRGRHLFYFSIGIVSCSSGPDDVMEYFERIAGRLLPRWPALHRKGVGQQRLVGRLLHLSLRYRWDCLRVIALQLALVAIGLCGLGLTGLGIDYLRHCVDARSPMPVWPLGLTAAANLRPMVVLVWIAAGVLVLAGGNAFLRWLGAICAADLSQRVLTDLRCEIYDKLQRLSFRYFDTHESSSLINRAGSDAQAVRTFVDGVIVKLVTVLLTLLIYFVYMLRVHVGLTLACLATTPLLWIGAVRFSRLVQPAYRRASELMDRAVTILVENVNGVHVVKGFGRQAEQIAKFAEATRCVRHERESIFWKISTFQPLMGAITQCSLLVLLAYGGILAVRREISLGAGLFVMANLLQEFAAQISNITNISNTIQSSLAGAQRVFDVLDSPVAVSSPARPVRSGRAQGSLKFDAVDFCHAAEVPVLRRVNLEVEAGQCLGIAGETGAGKSTMLALVARLYDVCGGGVRVDGIDVRDWDLNDLRRSVGIVFQECFLFSNTIRANIAFGHPRASQFEIVRAARLAAADRFIQDLPEGYDTVVGEHGSNLSGGQRQRLTLARALLHDPPILLLDDAMASVDPETEHEIQQAFDRSLRGRTTLLVSNRVSSLSRADRIVVLQSGRITQVGCPAELLDQPGYYRRLWELQCSPARRKACGA